MSQLYSRVFLQILDSSIAEDWQLRHVFEDVLKLTNDGVLDMTLESFSRRTNIPIEIVVASFKKLESPDPASRDSEEEGRRLIKLDSHRDWGWIVVNWEKYEAIKRKCDQREKTRERVRRHRSKKNTPPASPPTPPLTASSPSAASSPSPGTVLQKRYTALHSEEPTKDEQLTQAEFDGDKTIPKVQVPKVEPKAHQQLLEMFFPVFMREADSPVPYSEISAACEIVRRPAWNQEAQAILDWKGKLGTDSRFFPQSLSRLLNDWTTFLDRAKTFKPNEPASNGGNGKPTQSAAQLILYQTELGRIEKRLEWIRGQNSDASPLEFDLATERRKLRDRREVLKKILGFQA